MSSTDEDRARALAGALFDEVIVPLAEARKAAGKQGYFPRGPEQGASTYFEVPVHRLMQAADFDFPGGGTAEGLIDALAASWTAEGDLGLAAMAPRLLEIAAALKVKEGEADDSVSPLIYTMF